MPEEPLMIWGGLEQKREKTQWLLAQDKKKSAQQAGRKKTQLNKLEVQRLVAEGKKINTNFLPGPPRSLMVRP